MRRNIKKIICVLISCMFIMTLPLQVLGSVDDSQVNKSVDRAVQYLWSVQNADGGFPLLKGKESSKSITDWVTMALAAAGKDISSVKGYLQKEGATLEATTDYARKLLALSMAGCGTKYQDIDIAKKVQSFQQSSGQFAQMLQGEKALVNAHFWAVLALNSAGRDIPNKEKAKNWLVAQQNEDGGFSFDVNCESDPDDTGVVLCALSVLDENPQDSAAVKKAVSYLKGQQNEDGGFCWQGLKTNASTDAWVIQGLRAVGEDPSCEKWQVNGRSPVTHLLSLQNPDGSFMWMKDRDSNTVLITSQAILALSGNKLIVSGEKDDSSFNDVEKGSFAYAVIEELADAKIIGGYPDGSFKPNNTLTRAEFTKFMVCALNLQGDQSISASQVFDDVSGNYWAHQVISSAYSHGFVKGKGEKSFVPKGKITGAELAAMLVRAFPPEVQIKESKPYWYSGAIKTAQQKGLLYPGYAPKADVTRAQCAYSIAALKRVLAN